MTPDDDILESALNTGIKPTAKRYGIEESKVKSVVKAFKIDIEDLCMCEKSRLNGIAMMCFFCTSEERIKL